MEVKIKVGPNGKLPTYAHDSDAGFDFIAAESIEIPAGGYKMVKTGIYLEIPDGYHVEVRSRSGLAAKKGIFVLNSPGTIDSGYRGECNVILANMSIWDFVVNPGDRIAQGVLMQQYHADFEVVNDINESDRGEGGFGSTGVK